MGNFEQVLGGLSNRFWGEFCTSSEEVRISSEEFGTISESERNCFQSLPELVRKPSRTCARFTQNWYKTHPELVHNSPQNRFKIPQNWFTIPQNLFKTHPELVHNFPELVQNLQNWYKKYQDCYTSSEGYRDTLPERMQHPSGTADK